MTAVVDMRTPAEKQRSAEMKLRVRQDAEEQRERVQALNAHDRAARMAEEASRSLLGHDDLGSDGCAAQARPTVIEDADGKSAGSASREGVRTQRRRVVCECVLDRLFMRSNGVMTEAQYRAGLLFRRHWLKSRWSPRVSRDYSSHRSFGSSSVAHEAAVQSDARHEIDMALTALTPPQQRVVIRVCGEDQSVGLASRTLALALDALDHHWRVKKTLA